MQRPGAILLRQWLDTPCEPRARRQRAVHSKSDEGLAVAKANATLAGRDRWDLIAVIYGPASIADDGFVQRLSQALRPGGIVVVESFASPRNATRRRPVGIDPVHADGLSEWDPQTTSLVRMVAQKRP